MGTLGPGMFSDDEAADARDAWRAAVIDGGDLDAATERILRQCRDKDLLPGGREELERLVEPTTGLDPASARLASRSRSREVACEVDPRMEA